MYANRRGKRHDSIAAPGNDVVSRTVPLLSDTRQLRPVHDVLREVSVFADLSVSDLNALADGARSTFHPKGSRIVRQGEIGDSLLVIAVGVIEIVIERDPEPAISLCTFQAGDFFGELALFDGAPRSATAVALSDARVIEIAREALLSALTPQGVSRILAEVATRMRASDLARKHMADQMTRSAYSNPNSAVAVELEAIKTFYQRSELLAANTLERAERRAGEVLTRADATLSDVQGQIERALSLLKRRALPLAAAVMLVLGLIGVDSYQKLQGKLADVNLWYSAIKEKDSQVQVLYQRMQTAERSLRIVRETMTDLRAARDASGIDKAIDNPERLKRIALNYEAAKREILQRYLAQTANGPRYEEFEAEVVFEAVDTYVTLVMGGRSDGLLVLSAKERDELLSALCYVVSQLKDDTAPAQAGHSGFLLDRKLHDMLLFAAENADAPRRSQLGQDLRAVVQNGHSARARENAALVLGGLGMRDAMTLTLLSEVLHERKPMRAAASALALAKLGEVAGFRYLSDQLKRGSDAAFPVAQLLAEEGALGIEALTAKFQRKSELATLLTAIRRVLEAHPVHNCFEERYARYLVSCLDGRCENKPADGELGGACLGAVNP